jgi:Secretion system C-terminal sorting domain
MTFRNSRLFVTALILLTIGIISFASIGRWGQFDGVKVRQVKNISYCNATAQSSDGNIAIIWEDARHGKKWIHAQLYNSQNEAQWNESSGIPVSIGTGSSIYNDIIALDNGEWLVVSIDDNGEEYSPGNIYLQKLDSEGESLWGDQGRLICNSGGAYRPVKVFPSYNNDELDGVIAVWLDSSTGVIELYANKVDLNGTSIWSDEVLIGEDPYFMSRHDQMPVASDNQGGLVACWYTGVNENITLEAQRVSGSGELIWSGTNSEDNVIVSDDIQHRYNTPMIVHDGTTGFYVAWSNRRTGNSNEFVYAQYLDYDGNKIWSEENEVICNGSGSKLELNLVPSNGSCIAVWRNSNSNDQFYMQKFSNLDSSINIQWGSVGEEITALQMTNDEGNHFDAYVCPDDDGGFIVSWIEAELPECYQSPIYMQWFDTNGDPQWGAGEESGLLVGRVNKWGWVEKLFYSIHLRDSNPVLVWSDSRLDELGLFLQEFSDTGVAQLVEGGVTVISGRMGSAENPVTIVSNQNNYVGWQENSFGATPYIQRIHIIEGYNVFRENGISLMPGYPEVRDDDTLFAAAYYLNFIPDQEGGVIASWVDRRSWGNGLSIRAQKVNEEGDVLWGDFGTGVSGSEGADGIRYQKSVITSDGNGGAFVAFKFEINNQDILAFQHIDHNGNRLLSEGDQSFVTVNDAINVTAIYGIERFDDGSIIILYGGRQIVGSQIVVVRAMFVDDQGAVVGFGPIEFSDSDHQVEYAELQKVGNQFLVTWLTTLTSQTLHLCGNMISSDGTIGWSSYPDGKEFTEVLYSTRSYSTGSYDNSGLFWITWVNQESVYVQKYDMDGIELLIPSGGVTVSSQGSMDGLTKPQIATNSNGSVFVTWDEGVENKKRLFIHLDEYGNSVENFTDPDSLLLVSSLEYKGNMNMSAITDGQYSGFIAVWEDKRSGDGWRESNVYAQKIVSTLTSDAEYVNAPIPEEYVLHSAYPNPFNPTSVIAVGLPVTSELKVKVYNMLGKEVATLVDGKCSSGYHAFQFDASDMASGVYFVKAIVNGKMNQTQKIVLMK